MKDRFEVVYKETHSAGLEKRIFDQMLQNQTAAVDAVSGATCSSKVIRKAMENALAEGFLD